ncbi:MAG: carboxypeptidase-like regulatory domain-containing protein, partial [Nitrospira sp.]|nr:carboxypeptidase-like regulatory domain-containing protein [Nitrospira sp.]
MARFACLAIPATTDVTGRWSIRGVPTWLLDRLRGTAVVNDGELIRSRSVDGDPRLRAQLLDGTFGFVLAHGMAIVGEVSDPAGRRVAGAGVRILSASTFGGRATTTSAEGTFSFGNCTPGTNLVTVQAQGWAPRTVVAVAGPRSDPIRIVLAPGRPLHLRVTDPAGAPVRGVRVRLDSVPPDLSRRGTDPSITRAEFEALTDLEGRVTWNSAPDEDLTWVIGEGGNWAVQRQVLRPSDEEHTVRLSLALVTTGTVLDASSGTPIPRFRVSRAARLRDPASGDWVPALDPHTPGIEFVDGQFRKAWTHDDPDGSLAREGFYVRIEADGYEPTISHWISGQEGTVHLEFQLRASEASMNLEVRGPEGTPAGHAEVVTVDRRESPALLAPDGIGALLRNRMVRAGADGKVSVSTGKPSGPEWVVLAHHQEGMALVMASDVAGSRLLKLRAWAKIEGRLRDRTRPRSGVTLDLEGDFNAPDGLQPMLERFRTTTDGEGRFEFPRVPPGHLRLSIHDKALPASMSDGDSLDLPIETEPGKTLSLEIGADHRPIRLRLREPAILVLLASVSEGGEGAAAGRSSDRWGEGHGPRVTLGQTGNGVWSTSSAPPGRYRLEVLPGEAMTPSAARELKFVGEITVPPSPTGEVF